MCTCNYVDCKINDTCKCEVHKCNQHEEIDPLEAKWLQNESKVDDAAINELFAQASELEAIERHVAVTQGKIVELDEYKRRKNGKQA